MRPFAPEVKDWIAVREDAGGVDRGGAAGFVLRIGGIAARGAGAVLGGEGAGGGENLPYGFAGALIARSASQSAKAAASSGRENQ